VRGGRERVSILLSFSDRGGERKGGDGRWRREYREEGEVLHAASMTGGEDLEVRAGEGEELERGGAESITCSSSGPAEEE